MPISTHAAGDFDTELKDLVKGSEGHGPTVYIDPVGVPTVGFGYALVVKGPDGTWVVRLLDDINGRLAGTGVQNAIDPRAIERRRRLWSRARFDHARVRPPCFAKCLKSRSRVRRGTS